MPKAKRQVRPGQELHFDTIIKANIYIGTFIIYQNELCVVVPDGYTVFLTGQRVGNRCEILTKVVKVVSVHIQKGGQYDYCARNS